MNQKLFILLFAMLPTYCFGQAELKKSAALATASITGNKYVCANFQNETYNSSISQIGGTGISFKIEYTCGGAGTFVETGSNAYTIFNNSGGSSVCHVNWGNYPNSSSWVHVKISWEVLFVKYSKEATIDVGIGVTSTIPGINTSSAINIFDATPFTAICANGATLPPDASGYHWEVSGGHFSGGSTVADISGSIGHTISVIPDNSGNPVIVKVRYIPAFCPVSTAPPFFIKTIYRSIPAPATITASGEPYCGAVTTITYTCTPVAYATSYLWTFPPGWTPISSTNTNTVTCTTDGSGGTISVKAKYNNLVSTSCILTQSSFKDDSRHNLITLPNSDILYVGNDQKLHRLYFNGTKWVHNSVLTNSTVKVEGWLTKVGQNRVYFKSTDKKLYFVLLVNPNNPSTWFQQQVTQAGTTVESNIVSRGTDVFFINKINNQYGISRVKNYNICNALIPIEGWQTSGSNMNIPDGCLALAPLPANNVYFKTSNNKIFNLYGTGYSATTLHCSEIYTSGCTGEIVTHPATGNVYFKASDNKIHELKWSNNQWAESAINTSNTSYSVNGYLTFGHTQTTDWIYYKGTDNKIHRIYLSGTNYLDQPLSNASITKGDIVFFDLKLIYIGSDSKIRQYQSMTTSPFESDMYPNALSNVKSCSMQYDLLTK